MKYLKPNWGSKLIYNARPCIPLIKYLGNTELESGVRLHFKTKQLKIERMWQILTTTTENMNVKLF